MPGKTSTLFSRRMGYYLYLLRKSVPFMLVYSVLFLMTSPFLLYGQAISSSSFALYYSYSMQYGSLFGLPVFGLAALLPAVLNFKFLTSRSETDRVYSLPISGASLFFTHFAAGLTSVLIPYALFASPLPLLLGNAGVGTTGRIAAIQLLTAWYGLRALILLGFFAFAVFLCVNLGRIFDICLYYFLLLCVLPSICFSVINLLNTNLLGISGASTAIYSSPVLSFLSMGGAYGYSGLGSFANGGYARTIAVTIAVYAGVSVIFGALAFLLFRIRKREKAGTPFCFAYIKYAAAILISLFLGLVPVLAMSGTGSSMGFTAAILPFLIVSALVYLGVMAISKRSFRVLERGLLFYLGVPAIFSVLIAYMMTGAFGKVTYIPPTAQVASVTINLNEQNIMENTVSEQQVKSVRNINIEWVKNSVEQQEAAANGDNTKTFSTAKGIDTVKAFHNALLEHYKALHYDEKELNRLNPKASAASSTATGKAATKEELAYGTGRTRSSYSPVFTYRLKDGTTITRRYNLIPTEWIDDHYDAVAGFQETAPGSLSLRDSLVRYLELRVTTSTTVECGSAAPANSARFTKKLLDPAQIKQLMLDIYDDETKLTTAEEYDAKEYCVLRINLTQDVSGSAVSNLTIIKVNFSKTIALLNEYGFKPETEPQYSGDITMKALSVSRLMPLSPDGFIISDGSAFSGVYRATSYGGNDGMWDFQAFQVISDADVIRAVMRDALLETPADTDGLLVRFSANNGYVSPVYCIGTDKPSYKMLREHLYAP